jgi:hypothetical protein
VLATAVGLAGIVAAAGGMFRRAVRTDPRETVRLYAPVVAGDRDRANADVAYVECRLRLLAAAAGDDSEELMNGAARVLVAFVADGRPATSASTRWKMLSPRFAMRSRTTGSPPRTSQACRTPTSTPGVV